VKITNRQLKTIILEHMLKEMHDPNAVYQSETGETLDRDDLYDMIRDFSKEISGKRDIWGSEDKLDKMDIQQLADYYQGMSHSEDYENLKQGLDKERHMIDQEEFDPVTRAELAPKRQGFGRRPMGSKSQRRMESKARLKGRLYKIIKSFN